MFKNYGSVLPIPIVNLINFSSVCKQTRTVRLLLKGFVMVSLLTVDAEENHRMSLVSVLYLLNVSFNKCIHSLTSCTRACSNRNDK